MDFSKNSFTDTAFRWFTGVVEDINDPTEQGRLKVRCFGYHTENNNNKTGIPTYALPWAHVMTPITSASCGGIGQSATGIVQGSWVVGFFRDGEACQDPLILGTIPSATPLPSGYGKGFQDPFGDNPRNNIKGGVPNDQPYGATIEYKKAASYRGKVSAREVTYKEYGDSPNGGVPTALPPEMNQLRNENPDKSGKNSATDSEEDTKFDNDFFQPKLFLQDAQIDVTQPTYPNCHTTEYKCGHTLEVDETLAQERILTYHASGTYDEMEASGNRTVFVQGKGYRIVAKDDNVNIKGSCNITIDGDARTLIMGDEYREVSGNYHLKVNGNIYKKCTSEFVETIGDQVFNIGKRRESNIQENEIVNINAIHQFDGKTPIADSPGQEAAYQFTNKKSCRIDIQENVAQNINGSLKLGVDNKLTIHTKQDRVDVVNGRYVIKVSGATDSTDNKLNIDTKGEMTLDAPTGSIDFPLGNITSNNVRLHTHEHTQPNTGADDTSQGNTNSPVAGT
jgi:hypothetical protein